MTTRKEKITEKAIEILKENPAGVRYSELVRKIHEEFPEIPINTIHGTVSNLDVYAPNEVYKSSQPVYDSTPLVLRHVKFKEEK